MTPALMDLVVEQQKSALSESFRLLQGVFNVPRMLRRAGHNRGFTTAHRVVYTEGPMRLLQFHRESPPVWAEPLLICSAPVSRPVHSGSCRQSQRGPADARRRIRHLSDRLGHRDRGRPGHETLRPCRPDDEKRRPTHPQQVENASFPPHGILPGRHARNDIHSALPQRGERPGADVGPHRAWRRRDASEGLGQSRLSRRRLVC